ncbi:fumarate hydratase class II [bacterium MnTg03]|jgi:fumarate hydratase class II|nr:fumarate hydratase class II [bacterium MnTg03]
MAKIKYRTEKDSMGEIKVPVDALYKAQTQRAVNNFPVSGIPLPGEVISALGLIKKACARVNADLSQLDNVRADAIQKAAEKVISGAVDQHFPIDIFQTGSGTSSNMNANEVIATLASTKKCPVHPNDHVNMGQSSNDVFPSAIHVAGCIAIHEKLLPALQHLEQVIMEKGNSCADIVKTGRTHLMDAMPVTLGQEMSGWGSQIKNGRYRLQSSLTRLQKLAQGGTAVGTGINTTEDFGERVCRRLHDLTGIRFSQMDNLFEGLGTQDTAVETSGQLKVLAVSLMKIANDLRWMNSGPLAGLGEITLPALQPGSSIMPGKVNPVIPEAVAMACAQVIGNDNTITIAGQSGNFQLNVMLPLIAYNLLQSIDILSNSSLILADKAISGFSVNTDQIEQTLARNPILVTALNSVIGYELGAKIAKTAYLQKRPVIEVALELTDLDEVELKRLLDPALLTRS